MKKNLIKIGMATFAIIFLFISCSKGTKTVAVDKNDDVVTAEKSEIRAVLKNFKGTIRLQRKVNGDTKTWVIKNAGFQLKENDKVITSPGSKASIEFIGRGTTQLGGGGSLVITTLDDNNNINIKLNKGKMLCALRKLKRTESFNIKTPTAVAGVRGTSFVISSSAKNTKISVLTGKMSVKNDKSKKAVIIDEKKETQITAEAIAAPVIIRGVSLNDVKSLLDMDGLAETGELVEMRNNLKFLEIADKKRLDDSESVDKDLSSKGLNTSKEDVSVKSKNLNQKNSAIKEKKNDFESDDDMMAD
jgi:FecR-like protein